MFESDAAPAQRRRQAPARNALADQAQPTSVNEERVLAAGASRTTAYIVDSAKPTSAAKDYMTEGQCAARAQATQPAGWYKNHWSWCQTLTIYLTLRGNSGTVYGTASFQSTEIGRGYAGSRHVTVAQFIGEVAFDGDWTGTSVAFHMQCRGIPKAKHCELTRGGQTLYLYDGFTHTVHFRMDSTSDDSSGRDKISVGLFTPEMKPVGGTNVEHGYTNGFRCDSAKYLGSKGACIFDRAIGTFSLSRKDSAVNEAAKHAYGAIHGSKKAPTALSRMLDAKKQAKNNAKARATCRKKTPVRPAGKDCDEYPFKSTHQGAAYAHGHYSAKYIGSHDNQTAGRRLGAWFKSERILDGDRFNVLIM